MLRVATLTEKVSMKYLYLLIRTF